MTSPRWAVFWKYWDRFRKTARLALLKSTVVPAVMAPIVMVPIVRILGMFVLVEFKPSVRLFWSNVMPGAPLNWMDDSFQSQPGASCSKANTLNWRDPPKSDDAVSCKWASVIDPGTICDRSYFKTIA